MDNQLILLCATAAAVGATHAALGPDHYLPFIVMSRAWKWSPAKTAAIAFMCGLGHVLSSVLLALGAMAAGKALVSLSWFEALRGEAAGWLLFLFGVAYFAWGLLRARSKNAHSHDGLPAHPHGALFPHTHSAPSAAGMTPWVLFAIFVFGPCEPLIPLLLYPAARASIFAAALVCAVFSIATIGVMMGIIMLSHYQLSRFDFSRFERYSHAAAGFALMACGGAVVFLGL